MSTLSAGADEGIQAVSPHCLAPVGLGAAAMEAGGGVGSGEKGYGSLISLMAVRPMFCRFCRFGLVGVPYSSYGCINN